MILTCPECATSYFVDDSRIPPGGRTVKCSSCAHRWTATLEAQPVEAEPARLEAELEPAREPAEAPPEPAADQAREPVRAEAQPVPEDDLEIVAAEPDTRPRPQPTMPVRKGPLGAVVAWGVMAAGVAALVGGAIVFREQVVKLWPDSSGAYAGIGLPVNSLGLVIEGVKAEPTFQGGRPVLSVTGSVRNVADHAAEAPPIRIDLLDKSGKPVAAKIARPLDARVPAGARRHFAIAIIDPPSTARDLQVAFEGAEPKAAATSHTADAGHAPAAEEAQPLPADSPHAVPDHG